MSGGRGGKEGVVRRVVERRCVVEEESGRRFSVFQSRRWRDLADESSWSVLESLGSNVRASYGEFDFSSERLRRMDAGTWVYFRHPPISSLLHPSFEPQYC